MGNDIKTVRSTGSDYWAAYIGGEKKSKLTDLNDTPKPMLLPINDVSYHRRLVSFQNNDPTRFQFLRFKNEREAKNNAGH